MFCFELFCILDVYLGACVLFTDVDFPSWDCLYVAYCVGLRVFALNLVCLLGIVVWMPLVCVLGGALLSLRWVY